MPERKDKFGPRAVTTSHASQTTCDDGSSALFLRAERPMMAISMRIIAVASVAVKLAGIKLAGQRGVHIMEALFYRQFLSLPLVLAWLLMGPSPISVHTSRIGAHCIRMAAGMAGMVLAFRSVTLLPLAVATTISFTVPIFATILSALVLKETPGIHRWAGVVLGFCGVLVMIHPQGAGHFPPLGVAVALSAAIMAAVVNILLRQIGRSEGATTTVFWYTVLSLPPLGIGMYFFGQRHDLLTWGLLAAIGLTGGVGQLLLTASLRWAPVSVVMPMEYSSLIWATLLGWLIWNNWPGGSTWTGAVLIVCSGLYIAWREHVRNIGPS